MLQTAGKFGRLIAVQSTQTQHSNTLHYFIINIIPLRHVSVVHWTIIQ